jgi:putative redox protein
MNIHVSDAVRAYVVSMSTVIVSFPGGVAVDATYKGHTVRTDQPLHDGGGDSAMSPFDLFFASIAACMGFYALRFCQERGLPAEGLRLTLDPVRDEQQKRVTLVRVSLELPPGFPEKYRTAIERAVDHCTVKKHILEPPQFELNVLIPELQP